MSSFFRVEARNHNNKFDLLGVAYTMGKAQDLAKENDDYFVRIVECKNKKRKPVYRNYNWRDLLEI